MKGFYELFLGVGGNNELCIQVLEAKKQLIDKTIAKPTTSSTKKGCPIAENTVVSCFYASVLTTSHPIFSLCDC